MITDSKRVLRGTLGHREVTFLATIADTYVPDLEVYVVWDSCDRPSVSSESFSSLSRTQMRHIRDIEEL